MTDANKKGSPKELQKPLSQDITGIVCCLVGGFLSVSLFQAIRGQEPKSSFLASPVLGLLATFGHWPSLVLCLGLAVLGCLLFLRSQILDVWKPLGLLLGGALGLSFLFGGFGAEVGGAFGGSLPAVLPGFLGKALSAVIGCLLLFVVAWWGVLSQMPNFAKPQKRTEIEGNKASEASEEKTQSGKTKEALRQTAQQTDGVTAAEALFLTSDELSASNEVPSPDSTQSTHLAREASAAQPLIHDSSSRDSGVRPLDSNEFSPSTEQAALDGASLDAQARAAHPLSNDETGLQSTGSDLAEARQTEAQPQSEARALTSSHSPILPSWASEEGRFDEFGVTDPVPYDPPEEAKASGEAEGSHGAKEEVTAVSSEGAEDSVAAAEGALGLEASAAESSEGKAEASPLDDAAQKALDEQGGDENAVEGVVVEEDDHAPFDRGDKGDEDEGVPSGVAEAEAEGGEGDFSGSPIQAPWEQDDYTAVGEIVAVETLQMRADESRAASVPSTEDESPEKKTEETRVETQEEAPEPAVVSPELSNGKAVPLVEPDASDAPSLNAPSWESGEAEAAPTMVTGAPPADGVRQRGLFEEEEPISASRDEVTAEVAEEEEDSSEEADSVQASEEEGLEEEEYEEEAEPALAAVQEEEDEEEEYEEEYEEEAGASAEDAQEGDEEEGDWEWEYEYEEEEETKEAVAQADETEGEEGEEEEYEEEEEEDASSAAEATEEVTSNAENEGEENELVLQPAAPQEKPKSKSKAKAKEAPKEVHLRDDIEPLVYDSGLLILNQGRVAVSMLQRKFSIDFDQACDILDELQELGLIGPYLEGHKREILLSQEEWVERVSAPA